ncbi:hypothetical protein [Nocardia aurantiaca]|uniref:DNA primase n=1 Tax=Nocardia aurantiaca TaxID=2675850 RepID=A0A6I3L355_9NOCA|nr:hypothetical protein [Nocardia aurantiaca]MTE17473.1 hypothetical protein [Nocardia aurantiaca]
MKGGTRIAIGVGVGYLLGRTRKMRFALSLAGAAMSSRSTGMPAELLKRGTSLVKSSPELTQLTDTVRGELLGAVRSAAVTAASNRIDAFNELLQQGSTLVVEDRDRSRETGPDEDQTRRYAGEDEDLGDEDDTAGTHSNEDDAADRERPTPRARSSSPRTTHARKTGSRTSVSRSGSADRQPVSATRRRSRADADEAPVRRTRR